MALSATPITPVNDPNSLDSSNAASKVYPPQPGTTTTANDVGAAEQILRNQTHTLNEVKVDRAGDTMTGRLIVGAAAATNNNAIQATGDGTGAGITATGGSSGNGAIIAAGGGNNNGTTSTGAGTGSGVRGVGGSAGIGGTFIAGGGNNAGVSASGAGSGAGITATGGSTGNGGTFTAGGGNAHGIASEGAGTGSGITCTGGATGPGISAVNGTAQTNTAPTIAGTFAGIVQLTGTDPLQGVNPGANNAIHGINICKALCTVEVGAGGPYTKDEAYNVNSVIDIATGVYEVAFHRAMADANYAITFSTNVLGLVAGVNTKSTGGFRFHVFNTVTGNAVATTTTVCFHVFGRQ